MKEPVTLSLDHRRGPDFGSRPVTDQYIGGPGDRAEA